MEKRYVMKGGTFIGMMEYEYLQSTRFMLNKWLRTSLTGFRILILK